MFCLLVYLNKEKVGHGVKKYIHCLKLKRRDRGINISVTDIYVIIYN
jgi:hypothetical protein